ncbi:carbon monoxide dehydrogenase subunit G [Nonomuraea longicatena]|uniref:Carbon monoxide dehydrogenase subunit G n=1 Tax=Nonomuraea longicatena TaxID=83682 RepID=A0ABP3Z1P7_9ACTN
MIGIDRDRLWAAFQDPEVLVRTIPGCERLEESGPGNYRMTVSAGVASIKGVYRGEVGLSEPLAPESFVLRARGQGAPGTVEATVRVRLSEAEAGTRVDYEAEAVVGGMIGGVGQRMLGSVAKRTAAEFFTAVENHLRTGGLQASANGVAGAAPASMTGAARESAAAVGEGPPGATDRAAASGTGQEISAFAGEAGAPRVYERPAKDGPPKEHTQTRPWTMLAAFGMGAGVATAGMVIGWLLGRSGRR